MKRFDHISAQNYEEAAQLLAQGEGKRDAMAGGTDLLGTYTDRLLEEYPEAVVSLKKIPGYIREEKGELVLGAGTTLSEIAQSDAVKAYAQALAQAAYSVGVAADSQYGDARRQCVPGCALLVLSLSGFDRRTAELQAKRRSDLLCHRR